MDNREAELETADMIATLLNLIAYLISPILFIWAVNTLFGCGIAMSFQTWLAGLILIMLVRFHLRSPSASHQEGYGEYDEEYYDEEDEEDDFHDAPYDDGREEGKGKLIPYQDHKNRKNSSQDKSR